MGANIEWYSCGDTAAADYEAPSGCRWNGKNKQLNVSKRGDAWLAYAAAHWLKVSIEGRPPSHRAAGSPYRAGAVSAPMLRRGPHVEPAGDRMMAPPRFRSIAAAGTGRMGKGAAHLSAVCTA